MTGSPREPDEVLWKRGPYDLTAMARIQGPGRRAMALTGVAIFFVGMLTFAVVRTVRLGGLDGWSIFWFVVAALWGAGFATYELRANRTVERAARMHAPPKLEMILFRIGQLIRPDGEWTFVARGWVTVGDDRLTITSFKRRNLSTTHLHAGLVSARAITTPGSYGILRMTFTDGSAFESFPVGTGVHNLGLSASTVITLAAALDK